MVHDATLPLTQQHLREEAEEDASPTAESVQLNVSRL